jgi:hypothetical protein
MPALTLFPGQREGERERERERKRGKEREREHPCTLVSIKHAGTLSVPHSVSQSACVIIILIKKVIIIIKFQRRHNLCRQPR